MAQVRPVATYRVDLITCTYFRQQRTESGQERVSPKENFPLTDMRDSFANVVFCSSPDLLQLVINGGVLFTIYSSKSQYPPFLFFVYLYRRCRFSSFSKQLRQLQDVQFVLWRHGRQ